MRRLLALAALAPVVAACTWLATIDQHEPAGDDADGSTSVPPAGSTTPDSTAPIRGLRVEVAAPEPLYVRVGTQQTALPFRLAGPRPSGPITVSLKPVAGVRGDAVVVPEGADTGALALTTSEAQGTRLDLELVATAGAGEIGGGRVPALVAGMPGTVDRSWSGDGTAELADTGLAVRAGDILPADGRVYYTLSRGNPMHNIDGGPEGQCVVSRLLEDGTRDTAFPDRRFPEPNANRPRLGCHFLAPMPGGFVAGGYLEAANGLVRPAIWMFQDDVGLRPVLRGLAPFRSDDSTTALDGYMRDRELRWTGQAQPPGDAGYVGLLTVLRDDAAVPTATPDSLLASAHRIAPIGAAGEFVVGGLLGATLNFRLPDGGPNTTVGDGGVVSLPFGVAPTVNAMVPLPDGTLFVAGTTSPTLGQPRLRFVRVLADGGTDPALADAGATPTSPPDDQPRHAVVLKDGRVVVVGTRPHFSGRRDLVLWAFHPDGGPDAAFGTDGVTRVELATDVNDLSRARVDADGRIVVIVTQNVGNATAQRAVVLRYWP